MVDLRLESRSPDAWLYVLSTVQSSSSMQPQSFPLNPAENHVFHWNPSNFFSTSLSQSLDKSCLYLLYREEDPVKHHYLKGNYDCNNEFFHILEWKKHHFWWGEGNFCFSATLSILESLLGPIWASLFCRYRYELGETFDLIICFFLIWVPIPGTESFTAPHRAQGAACIFA